jgi:hypothetical protein
VGGAFVRELRDEKVWRWTSEPDLDNVNPDGIVFADTRAEADAAFSARFPCPDDGLTYHYRFGSHYYRGHENLQSDDLVMVYPEPICPDTDADSAADLAKIYGSVRTNFTLGEESYRTRGENKVSRGAFVGTDCVPVDDEDWPYGVVVHHRPARCRAAQKAAKTRATNIGVSPNLFHDVYSAMLSKLHAIDRELFKFEVGYGNTEADRKWHAVHAVETIMPVFIFIYGKYAYRRLPEFQKAKKEWRRLLLRSNIEYGSCGHRRTWSGGKYITSRFVAWMNYEITVRKPVRMELDVPSTPPTFVIPEDYDAGAVVRKAEERQAERKRKEARKKRKAQRAAAKRRGKKSRKRKPQPVRSDEQGVQGSVQTGSPPLLECDEGVPAGALC